ncbi:MAG: lipid-A-disaccharide synthase [Gammaproteobacteria bacterium]|nr:lipid-A-disaccharide synthase [Gammaproteobacteria bacterium]
MRTSLPDPVGASCVNLALVESQKLRIGIVAGEASGDYLGAALIKALVKREPNLETEGVGGPRMREAGCRILYPMEMLSVMGLVEVLGKYLKIAGMRRDLIKHFTDSPPDIFIGVDAPDFNLEVERRLRTMGIKTVHFVSPQVWAWREYRLKKIARSVDLMLTLFPFEETYYKERGLQAICVGHPLANQIPLRPDPAAARTRLGLPQDKTVIALMPGSRPMEVNRLTTPFLLAALQCRKSRHDIHFVSNLIDDNAIATMRATIDKLDLDDLPITLFKGQSHDVLEAADVVLLASGTVALETMLFKKPMVVAYKLNWISYWLLKMLVRVKYVSLPNLLAGTRLVPECLQADCTPDRLAAEILYWLDDNEASTALARKFTELHKGLLMDAADNASRLTLSLVQPQ